MDQPSITAIAGNDKYDFNVAQFNKTFDQTQMTEETKHVADENVKLQALNNGAVKAKTLDQLTLADFLIGFATTIFGIMNDLLSFKFDSITGFITIFTKNNRLFFIGIIMLFFSSVIYYLSD